jgi:hypothetical protein
MPTHRKHKGALIILGAVITALLVGIFVMVFTEKVDIAKEPEPTFLVDPNPPEQSFLKEEEVVIIPPEISGKDTETIPLDKVLFEYIEVTAGCGPHFENPEECVNVRSGPGIDFPIVTKLRNDIVLKVGGQIERDDEIWYKIVFDEYLFYPERVTGDWYVSSDFVEVLLDEGEKVSSGKATSSKVIIINVDEQKLYAKNGGDLFMEVSISTGLELTPTPKGIFNIFKKMPSRYMQGPFPKGAGGQYYDLPGVPWNLYFTHGGAVIHGAYWHTSFGSKYSHGCVNIDPDTARKLYNWAELGTTVVVE